MRLAASAAVAASMLIALPACSTEPIQQDPPRATQTASTAAAPLDDFSATGELPCSADSAALDRRCIFGISIAGNRAALQVVNPTSDVEGIQRVLLYERGQWSTLSGATAETRRIDGGSLIVVDGREFYALPAQVFAGG